MNKNPELLLPAYKEDNFNLQNVEFRMSLYDIPHISWQFNSIGETSKVLPSIGQIQIWNQVRGNSSFQCVIPWLSRVGWQKIEEKLLYYFIS